MLKVRFKNQFFLFVKCLFSLCYSAVNICSTFPVTLLPKYIKLLILSSVMLFIIISVSMYYLLHTGIIVFWPYTKADQNVPGLFLYKFIYIIYVYLCIFLLQSLNSLHYPLNIRRTMSSAKRSIYTSFPFTFIPPIF